MDVPFSPLHSPFFPTPPFNDDHPRCKFPIPCGKRGLPDHLSRIIARHLERAQKLPTFFDRSHPERFFCRLIF